MKNANANLITMLATVRQFAIEDVATIVLADGNTSITLSTNRGNAATNQPIFKRGGVRCQLGVEVSTMSVDLLCNNQSTLANLPAISFAYDGGLDGARLTCVRNFAANGGEIAAGNVVGSLHIFQGGIGDLDVDAAGVHFTVNSDMELLNQQMPRNVYQAGCLHDVYDAGCGIVAANFTVTGVIQGGNSSVYTIGTNLLQNAGYFDLGTITLSNGPLAGLSRTVKTWSGDHRVTPVLPFPSVPPDGTIFTIKPGCDKLFATCNTTFNNAANFRGYEFIPVPETSY